MLHSRGTQALDAAVGFRQQNPNLQTTVRVKGQGQMQQVLLGFRTIYDVLLDQNLMSSFQVMANFSNIKIALKVRSHENFN